MKIEQLLDVLNLMGIKSSDVTLRREGQVQIHCPLAPWFHKKKTDEHPSCSIGYSDDKPTVFKCFSCHEKGKLSDLVDSFGVLASRDDLKLLAAKLLNEDKPNLGIILASAAKTMHTWVKEPRESRKIVIDPKAIKRLPVAADIPECREYLTKREIPPNAWHKFDLRYDYRDNRIVFPVYNEKNDLVGAVGRTVPFDTLEAFRKTGPKYRNYFGFIATNSLGGENHLHPDRKKLVLVEGYFCLLRGYEYVEHFDSDIVCTWHAEISPAQADKIISFDRTVYVFYNNDEAGNDGWEKAYKLLHGRVPTLKRAVLKPKTDTFKEDVGDMVFSRFKELMEVTKRRLSYVGT